MKTAVSVGLFLWIGLWNAKVYPQNEAYVLSGFAQGTTYYVKYYSDKEILQYDIDSILNDIDLSMSLYKEESLISQFNDSTRAFIKMDEHMRKVIEKSFRMYELSGGYFDISVFPLIELWGFGPKGSQKAPSAAEIDSVRQYVGMDKLFLHGDTLYKLVPRVRIDLNGIAQGYSVDVISQHLSDRGIDNFIVEIGGEIKTKGKKPDGTFRVMLDESNDTEPRLSRPVLSLQNRAVTTSSIREKKYEIGNTVISHHMNPVSGWPIKNNNRSVTVIAETAMLADALDNYLMALNPPDAIAFVEKMPKVEMCVYYQENKQIKVMYSSGFNNYLYN